ncbi:maleylpyruvate isomerase family mycothiol-dependent enzyme [Streptacidiphilus sp. P02-A3a]|uniref:maleylpyruvate isomerase family mycothiol-dependent enzyme n=1 Tax=Streptacidiphilus sp. P02-A3a TaxID=2704468 RepID=UPI0015F81DF7|nr:maleylpyruvate isomerase family mycothiol-dependent enzyme [Streptacidiphilus sp. P02-A3a]QMU67596.1 maleylpyruvate isomerase family mycothiol-dependent enzyme [Streptacidiphilus sp. P02-A3a]
MATAPDFEPAPWLTRITVAIERLLGAAAGLGVTDVRGPSLLPGWSRGHVLTHLARNADGGRHLLTWARTGVETPEYPSMAARAEQIEAGSGRGPDALLADLRDSSARFAAEYARMPADAWQRLVRWTEGQRHPVLRAADSRLTEVLIHHVDLAIGYTPDDWPPDFVEELLHRLVTAHDARPATAAMRLHATDTDTWYDIHPVPGSPTVRGTRATLLAWLVNRPTTPGPTTADGSPLPQPPALG